MVSLTTVSPLNRRLNHADRDQNSLCVRGGASGSCVELAQHPVGMLSEQIVENLAGAVAVPTGRLGDGHDRRHSLAAIFLTMSSTTGVANPASIFSIPINVAGVKVMPCSS